MYRKKESTGGFGKSAESYKNRRAVGHALPSKHLRGNHADYIQEMTHPTQTPFKSGTSQNSAVRHVEQQMTRKTDSINNNFKHRDPDSAADSHYRLELQDFKDYGVKGQQIKNDNKTQTQGFTQQINVNLI